MRYLFALVMVSCVPPHFDDHPLPAHDVVWMSAGAGIDAAQQVLHVRWFVRYPVEAGIAAAARIPEWGGHHLLDSGFGLLIGALGSTMLGCVWRGLHHDSHCIR